MRNARWMLWVGATVVLVLLTVNSGVCNKDTPPRDELYQQMEAISEVMALIKSDYVSEVDNKTLVHGALKGMMAALDDPHTQFMPPDMFEMMKAETEGEFGGVGIEISIREGFLTVISPVDGSPAMEVGIKAGDRIVKIDEKITRDITLLEAVKQLRGEPGTKVKLVIMREGEEKFLEKILTRAIIKVEAVRDAKIITDGIGYVRLTSFQTTSDEKLAQALKELKEKGMQSLIIDLRNNTGGALDVAIRITSHFLPTNEPVVSTRGRMKGQNIEYRSRPPNDYLKEPMVVLVNQGSASASEILAGAIQDQNRGIILGTKTFGKGSVQILLPLTPLHDGSGLRMTTGKWFTPSGRSIQDEGITPDIVVAYQESSPKKKDVAEEVFEQIEEKDKLDKAEGPVEAKSEPAKEEEVIDNQLERAVDLLKGLQVYEKFRAKTQ